MEVYLRLKGTVKELSPLKKFLQMFLDVELTVRMLPGQFIATDFSNSNH